jgi:sec-independent protein translocase protein TatB
MFGIDSAELLIIAVVALVVIGPKDLPRVMRTLGNFIGRARGMARHFRSGIDTMIREAELEDMEKMWKSNNDRIMREHPATAFDKDWGKTTASDFAAADAPPIEPAASAPAAEADGRPKAPPRRGPRKRAAAAAPPPPGRSPDDAA